MHDLTGELSVYTNWRNIEIMFHVSTYLPYERHDTQKVINSSLRSRGLVENFLKGAVNGRIGEKIVEIFPSPNQKIFLNKRKSLPVRENVFMRKFRCFGKNFEKIHAGIF